MFGLIVLVLTVVVMLKCGWKRNASRLDDRNPSVVPKRATIPADGGYLMLYLINPTSHRYAYKVKTTNPAHFFVGQSFGFLEQSEVKELVVKRVPGMPRSDQIGIFFKKTESANVNVKTAFENCRCPAYQRILEIDCQY